MSFIEENEVKTVEPVTEIDEAVDSAEAVEDTAKKEVSSRWIEDEASEKTEVSETSEKKKAPFIQAPVIISMCLVIVSLLAFFAYRIFWIAEPEGVLWTWSSETDDVNWYYEFKDDNVFKAYVGSFEVTANYSKDKSNEEVNKLMVSANVPYASSMGCVFFGSEINYTITGSRIGGSQEMTITYPDDPEGQEFVLKQTDKRDSDLELPDDFTEDKDLTGEWINTYSTADAKQTIVFGDDGSMILAESYTFSDGSFTEIRRNCTYTVDNNEINITWVSEEPVVHHSTYEIKDGVLNLDGATYYRADGASTPDQAE